MNINAIVRRKDGGGQSDEKSRLPIRMSGTNPDTEVAIDKSGSSDPMDQPPIGRTGNDYSYPDYPRGYFQLGTVNGDRLQDIANTHLSEQPEVPGRIPRPWNNRYKGKTGRGLTGNESGSNEEPLTVSGESAGGTGDMVYIPHIFVPRGSVVARAYMRTVDDAAAIPAVYVSDAARR